MSLDLETFLQHTPAAEKTIIHTQKRNQHQQFPALLIAQTPSQKLFVTLEAQRRYVTHTIAEDNPDELELDFVEDYAEVEAILEDAGLYGVHDGEVGIVYHNLLFLLMNPEKSAEF
ncbi:hypothetical protein BXP70_11085 [Hymenobacter crusticola]|uniref:Uncharacterized protein n=2 Tax=Hymenobacter crusticola TaxID=1770526 RepID=A0A243WGG5_9BACT|nr:hypothetical protein BXP70_11085 [Hymenobacter crusticola]